MSDPLTIALLVAIAVLILLPPKYDPAIRLKEFNEREWLRLREKRRK